MIGRIGPLVGEMIGFFGSDTRRIGHFLKVWGFAAAIGKLEGLDPETQEILEAAAVVHDIGIRPSEEKYGSSAGHYQELEGPPLAKEMLRRLGYPEGLTARVSFLVGHHHTYGSIDGIDYQILVEADFLVNISEDRMDADAVSRIRGKIFRTKTGLDFLDAQYPPA
ncbi:HD domain-containing protein [Papillibacter cinnamivorans]|uniref:HD domain-containing protein n=1 Tax=Papillibacter cinnamivorans DSM 12816 TaxID=1122930 RepID=A0A1W1ZQH4_9FIRM|nr:HD domain-containing protein [Papillibacter cinnamivorans]SMC50617.1 HD domain-containing protein [Papillibacter cinnamivorans DSM 12816]